MLAASSLGCGMCGCVARGSRIRTPDGRRRIEDLEVGDTVFSLDPETGKFVEGEIVGIDQVERECLALELGGTTLKYTSNRPVYDPDADEYAPAGDWVRGKRSSVLVRDDDSTEVRTIEETAAYAGISQVFDLTVGTEHSNFVADGFLVHNKSPPATPPDTDVDVQLDMSEDVDGTDDTVENDVEIDGSANDGE